MFLSVFAGGTGTRGRHIAELASSLDISVVCSSDTDDDRLYEAEFIHLADCSPRECITISGRARRKEKRVGLDPGECIDSFSPEQFEEGIRRSSLLFLSGPETRSALRHIQTKADPSSLLIFVDAVVVTCTAGTATLYTGKHAYEYSATSEGISNLKGGTAAFADGFRAGFYAALGHGMRLQPCGRAATKCGASCATGRVPTWMELVIGL